PGVELAVRLADKELYQDGCVQVHARGGQSRASRSARTRISARLPLFTRPRSKAWLTRNVTGVLPTRPTSLALGRPAEVMTISSPAAARSSSFERCALAVRTFAFMVRV